MQSTQKPEGMKNAAAIINNLKTPNEKNLAAALLVSLVCQPEKPKRKRRAKPA